jgi:Flavodoxin
MRVLILYESRRGHTLTAARAIRDALRDLGLEATAAPLRRTDPGTIAAADAFVVGTWVKGLLVVGVGPAKGTEEGIRSLPRLDGKPAIAFCTCDLAPRRTLDSVSEWLEERGADVRGTIVFRRSKSLARTPEAAAAIAEAFATV